MRYPDSRCTHLAFYLWDGVWEVRKNGTKRRTMMEEDEMDAKFSRLGHWDEYMMLKERDYEHASGKALGKGQAGPEPGSKGTEIGPSVPYAGQGEQEETRGTA